MQMKIYVNLVLNCYVRRTNGVPNLEINFFQIASNVVIILKMVGMISLSQKYPKFLCMYTLPGKTEKILKSR